jgi:hypothetical protein
MKRISLIVFGTLLLAAEPAPKAVTCTFRKKEDTAKLQLEPGALVVTITSVSGIGGAVVDTHEAASPLTLLVRFPGLRSLESFSIEVGDVSLANTLRAGEDSSVKAFDAKGNEVKETKNAPYVLAIRRADKENAIMVILRHPGPEPKGRRWKLDWIDAFRR